MARTYVCQAFTGEGRAVRQRGLPLDVARTWATERDALGYIVSRKNRQGDLDRRFFVRKLKASGEYRYERVSQRRFDSEINQREFTKIGGGE